MADLNTHVAAALTAAADLIDKGWCQGRATDGEARCLVGALAETTVTTPGSGVPGYLVWAECKRVLCEQLPDGYASLAEWNDQPTTTKAKVVRFLRDAAGQL